jgi:hypothetical protein
LDIDKFLSFLKEGEEKEKEGDMRGALSLYVEAMRLCQPRWRYARRWERSR